MRAGLGLPANTLEEIVPKGDMDVMLSMRAQGLISRPIPENDMVPESGDLSMQTTNSSLVFAPDPSFRFPQTTKTPPSGPVSALKGLLTGSTRPRSTSRATSIYLEPDTMESSVGSVRSNSIDVSQNGTREGRVSPLSISPPPRSPTFPTSASQGTSCTPTGVPSLEQRINQQISSGQSGSSWSGEVDASTTQHIHVTSMGTLSLQPPPNRKRWSFHGPKISTDDSAMYKHNNGNCSVACNFGLESSPVEERPPPSPTPTSTSFSTPEQRVRTGSLRSISTVASAELGGPKRWSRQSVLTKRLTPPSGPRPPIVEAQVLQNNRSISRLQTQHPYSGDRCSSPSSSFNSPQSGLTSSSKRESSSSAYSISTANTSHSRINGPLLQGSFHRRSVPTPPPRPAPNFALPSPPTQPSPLASAATTRQVKNPFRESVARRGLRLSLSAQKPAPSTSLPPRPDEKGHRSHRRTSSHDDKYPTTKSYPIPPPSMIPSGPRYPPPSGPLPPPPPTSSAPVSRHTSIKQRLRILSAPSSTPSAQSLTLPVHVTTHSPAPPISESVTDLYASQPSTPIGEPITIDPNFLIFSSSEPAPSSDCPRPPEPFSNALGLTSLSPPPRRGSRQISNLEKDKPNVEAVPCRRDDHDESVIEQPEKSVSLTHRASFTSLGM